MTLQHKARAAALVAALLLLGTGTARAVDVLRSGYGSAAIGGLAQAAWVHYIGDDIASFTVESNGTLADPMAVDRPVENEFVLQRLRLRLSGEVVTERVRYFAQAEYTGENVALLDARLSFGYLPYTWLHFGRWAPSITFFSGMEPEDILFVDYPLMDDDPFGHALHSFRDTGVEADVDFRYIEVRLGVFNGQDAGPMEGDNNSAKDFVFGIEGRPPVRGLKLHATFRQSLVFDSAQSSTDSDGEFKEENDSSQEFIGGAWYVARYGPIAVFEAAYSITTPAEEDQDERNLFTWYAMAGFDFWWTTGLPVQLIGRYDSMDPNLDESDDEYAVVTGAFNYSFEKQHARVALNYLHRIEWFDVTGADKGGQRGFDNDELKLQVQVAF